MKKLYIIGNGFDLHHGMKTSYSDFHTFINNERGNYKELVDYMENYYVFSHKKSEDDEDKIYHWTNFENDLGKFNYDHFIDQNDFNLTNRNEIDGGAIFGVVDELSNQAEDFNDSLTTAWKNWIRSIDIKTTHKLKIDKNACYINFNYTCILQKHYNIPNNNILHIHGCIEKNEPLIFGHGVDQEEIARKMEKSPQYLDILEASIKSLNNTRKDVIGVIKENQNNFNKIKEMNEIVVLGHSISEIDIDYYKEIRINSPNATWKVSYYSGLEKRFFFKSLTNIGINKKQISFFRMDDFNIEFQSTEKQENSDIVFENKSDDMQDVFQSIEQH